MGSSLSKHFPRKKKSQTDDGLQNQGTSDNAVSLVAPSHRLSVETDGAPAASLVPPSGHDRVPHPAGKATTAPPTETVHLDGQQRRRNIKDLGSKLFLRKKKPQTDDGLKNQGTSDNAVPLVAPSQCLAAETDQLAAAPPVPPSGHDKVLHPAGEAMVAPPTETAHLKGNLTSSGEGVSSATNDFITVLPAITKESSTNSDLLALQKECPRFRILIIGKAGCGKTTILQKMCNTTEAPVICDRNGRIIDPSVIQPTDGRGIHDINNELIFSSNHQFVFHDSPGFEGGSVKELVNVRGFIAERAATTQLKDQLHAIWYCLPVDNDRPLTDSELSFFEEGTGRVPVIAIFTKYEGMLLREYNRLRFEQGHTRDRSKEQAQICADELLRNSDFYLKRLLGVTYPPAGYLRLQEMHRPGSDCAELSKQTLDALFSRELTQFRILVIGKANAGKTTLLQKTCNTTEMPVIHDQYGVVQKDDPNIIKPTDGRGIHNINYELTFPGNNSFVFHDSPGFEAGSAVELQGVRDFIAQRAVAKKPKDQLHAIWYCLPTDNDRPLSDAEMSFFDKGTGRVPVIAIFTKYDAMILKAYNKLRFEECCSKEVARKLAPAHANELFRNSQYYLKRVQGATFPPAKYLRLQEMHKPESNCDELRMQTEESLDSRKLQLLFASVQQNNIGLCTKFALRDCLIPAITNSGAASFNKEAIIAMLTKALLFYGHLKYAYKPGFSTSRTPMEDLFDIDQYVAEGNPKLLFYRISPITMGKASTLESTVLTLGCDFGAGQDLYAAQALGIGISILIIAEDSFWLKNTGLAAIEAFKLAAAQYCASNRYPAATNAAIEAFKLGAAQYCASNRYPTVTKILREVYWYHLVGDEDEDEDEDDRLVVMVGKIIREFRAQP